MSIHASLGRVARRLARALTVGGAIFAIAGPATANDNGHRGYRDGHRHDRVVQREYIQHHNRHRHNRHRYAHRRHKRQPRKIVINNYYGRPAPVVVARRIYVGRPVVVAREVVVRRPVVIERPVYIERQYPPLYAPANGAIEYAPTITAGALIGAAVGGLVGAQIGEGQGNLAATAAAGAVGGFVLGDRVERRSYR